MSFFFAMHQLCPNIDGEDAHGCRMYFWCGVPLKAPGLWKPRILLVDLFRILVLAPLLWVSLLLVLEIVLLEFLILLVDVE